MSKSYCNCLLLPPSLQEKKKKKKAMFFSGWTSLQDFLTESWHKKYAILHMGWKLMVLILKAFILTKFLLLK